MFQDSFKLIEHGDAAKILDQLNPLLDGSAYDPAITRILSHPLPFYAGYDLVEVSDYDVNPPRQTSFIYKGDEITLLNGKNEPIYEINKKAPIALDEKNIFLYVRFFFHYVQGRFGKFNIVENVEEINWKEEPSPAGMKALSKMVHVLKLKPMQGDEYHLTASIVFKDSLFQTDIKVQPNGQVDLLDQELLVEDIPVLDDVFAQ